MKLRAIAILALSSLLTLSAALAEEAPMHPKKPANAGLEKLKSLVGTWERKSTDGQTTKLVYTLVSEGSALMEQMIHGDSPMMVTMYHADGPEVVMMTHYCGANNQPRMKAKIGSGDLSSLQFDFVDCANLGNPDEGHMHALKLTFKDADHLVQEWSWVAKGKQEGTEVFDFTRKKA